MKAISDKEFEGILKSGWDQICHEGFAGFVKNGPGLVAVAIINDEFNAMFTHPAEGHITDPKVLGMINEYNPELQVIVQYVSGVNRVKTLKLEMGESQDSPKTIWENHNILVSEPKSII